MRKVCSRTSKIAILLQFLPIDPHFVRKGWRFVTHRRHHPRPKERKIKKARERKGREKGEKMWRWEDVREGVKMSRCEDEQMWEKMWRWADVREDVREYLREDVKLSRCEDEQMWRWEGVKMSRCEDEQMWRWTDVKMRRCEDEKMRYRPPLLEEPCAQTLSGKKISDQVSLMIVPCLTCRSYWGHPIWDYPKMLVTPNGFLCRHIRSEKNTLINLMINQKCWSATQLIGVSKNVELPVKNNIWPF